MIKTTRPTKFVEPRLFRAAVMCGDVFVTEYEPEDPLLVVYIIPHGDTVMVRPLDHQETAQRVHLPSLRFVGHLGEDGVLRIQAGEGGG